MLILPLSDYQGTYCGTLITTQGQWMPAVREACAYLDNVTFGRLKCGAPVDDAVKLASVRCSIMSSGAVPPELVNRQRSRVNKRVLIDTRGKASCIINGGGEGLHLSCSCSINITSLPFHFLQLSLYPLYNFSFCIFLLLFPLS